MKKGSYKDYADLLRQLDTKRLAKGKQLFSLTGSCSHGQKSLGQYSNIHIFLSFLGSLIKQCILFEIFLQFSLPQPIQSWNSEKNSGYTRPTFFVGWGEGLDLCELENAEEMQKCPKTLVHECTCLGWTMEADSPHSELNRLPWETACVFLIVLRSLPESFLVFSLACTHQQTY